MKTCNTIQEATGATLRTYMRLRARDEILLSSYLSALSEIGGIREPEKCRLSLKVLSEIQRFGQIYRKTGGVYRFTGANRKFHHDYTWHPDTVMKGWRLFIYFYSLVNICPLFLLWFFFFVCFLFFFSVKQQSVKRIARSPVSGLCFWKIRTKLPTVSANKSS